MGNATTAYSSQEGEGIHDLSPGRDRDVAIHLPALSAIERTKDFVPLARMNNVPLHFVDSHAFPDFVYSPYETQGLI
jgi:hypothetical protein